VLVGHLHPPEQAGRESFVFVGGSDEKDDLLSGAGDGFAGGIPFHQVFGRVKLVDLSLEGGEGELEKPGGVGMAEDFHRDAAGGRIGAEGVGAGDGFLFICPSVAVRIGAGGVVGVGGGEEVVVVVELFPEVAHAVAVDVDNRVEGNG